MVFMDRQIETIRDSHNQVATSYYRLLTSNEYEPDFVIVSHDGHEVKCHRNVLSLRWPWFATMLDSNMVEAKTGSNSLLPYNLLVILTLFAGRLPLDQEGMDGSTLTGFVRYLYTGEFDQFNTAEACAAVVEALDYYRLVDNIDEHRGLLEHCDKLT